MFKLPSLYYKIDGSSFLPGNNLTSAAFNPCHPLLAVITYDHLFVITYGGEPRHKRGQIIFGLHFTYPSLMYRSINWSPSGNYLLCLEEDKELCRSKALKNNKLRVFYYNSTIFTLNEIIFKFPLVPSPAMNTRFLWLDGSSFIFADERKNIFRTVTLQKNNTYEETKVDLSAILEPLRDNKKRTKFISYVNSLFVLPDPLTPYLFFLTCCPVNHQHQRILYVDKKTHKIEKVVSLPGEVVSIAVHSNRFFLLLQTRPYENYKYNSPIVAETDFEKCLFSDPFIGKISDSDFENYSRESFIFRGDSTGIMPFRHFCGCGTLEVTENLLKKDTNMKAENLFLYLGKLAKATDLYLTNDYLYHVSKITQRTKVFGANHHFVFDICLKDDWVLPPMKFVAYFHPNKPIFIRKKRGNYFDINLLPWATDDDKTAFPEIDEDDQAAAYNESITFLPTYC
jgi:hypothetical protein